MENVITVPFTGNAEDVYTKAKKRAEASGISMEGDSVKGQFSGLGAVGSYETSGQTVTITLLKKPAMFPQAMIEALVKKMFS